MGFLEGACANNARDLDSGKFDGDLTTNFIVTPSGTSMGSVQAEKN